MTASRFALPALIVGLMGVLWGCTPSASGPDKSLEVRIAKLEQELKVSQDATAKSHSQFRQEQAKTKQLEQERDDAQALVKQRTNERDGTVAQYDSFRKNIKELLGQADAAASGRPPEFATK